MPKIKKGLNYFDIETDINNDMRVKLLRAEYGIKGFGIWIQLLIQIYADEGYFMKWDNDTKLLFASDVGESGGLVDEVIHGSVKRGLFDESVFDQFDVLTSKHIQEKYFDAIKRRESEIKVDARFLVIPTNVDIISSNENIKLLNVNKSAQSKVKESKVKESREEYRESVRMKPDEYQKLCDKHGKPFTEKCLDKLNNYKLSKGKKYKSDYRAILSWVVEAVQEDEIKRRSNKGFIRNAGDRQAEQLRETPFEEDISYNEG